MKTAREIAHELEMRGKGCERWCSLDDDPEPPIHTPACNALTAAIEARDKEHAAERARERETALEVLTEVEQLISDSAPLSWAACGNMGGASRWEKRATSVLERIRALRSPPTDGKPRACSNCHHDPHVGLCENGWNHEWEDVEACECRGDGTPWEGR